jgi:hypothetical protein
MADPRYAHIVVEAVGFQFDLSLDRVRNRHPKLISPDQWRIENELGKIKEELAAGRISRLPVAASWILRSPPSLESEVTT